MHVIYKMSFFFFFFFFLRAFKNAVELKKLFKEDLLKEVMPSPSASKQERNPRSPRIPFNDDDPLRIPSRRRERQPRWLVAHCLVSNNFSQKQISLFWAPTPSIPHSQY